MENNLSESKNENMYKGIVLIMLVAILAILLMGNNGKSSVKETQVGQVAPSQSQLVLSVASPADTVSAINGSSLSPKYKIGDSIPMTVNSTGSNGATFSVKAVLKPWNISGSGITTGNVTGAAVNGVYNGTISTAGFAPGIYNLEVSPLNCAPSLICNLYSKDYIAVAIDTEITPPTVTVTPANRTLPKNGNVTLTATATDPSGVGMVTIYVDGVPVCGKSASSCTYTWRMNQTSAGAHNVTVVALDNTFTRNRAEVSNTFTKPN